MIVRRPTDADRRSLAAFAAPLQRRAEHHVAYLGTDPDGIAAEMAEDVADWTEAAAVAEDNGRVVGWLMASIDHDIGRAWWFGPFVDSDDAAAWCRIADRLDDVARAGLRCNAAHVPEEEYAFDTRHLAGEAWAAERGFVADPASAVLTLEGSLQQSLERSLERSPGAPMVTTRPATPADADAVGRLHDELFAGTHTRGDALVASTVTDRPRLVAERDAVLAGYVAVERQPEGSGYIDYLGVAPAFRRQGVGAELVRAGVEALVALGCDHFHLTVGEANTGARVLYVALGFTEERVVRPLRRGFSLR